MKRYTRGAARIMQGDVLRWAETYEGPQFHALLSDPPYELGFMGKNWDKSGIVFNADTWQLLSQHLLPGAFGMVFASARGYHRVACAIEDAGLIIHPSIFGWSYGSGFPKASRIDRMPIEAFGSRENSNSMVGGKALKNRCGICNKPFFSGNPCKCPKPQSDSPFSGHRYGLQALKPALEPIIVFQKPYDGKPLDSMVKYGSGALNIDAGRIPSEKIHTSRNIALGSSSGGIYHAATKSAQFESHDSGRWPANFYVDAEAAKRLDMQSGDRPVAKTPSESVNAQSIFRPGQGAYQRQGKLHQDSGGASRYFFNVESQVDESDPVFYCAKVSKKERNAGLGALPLRIADPYAEHRGRRMENKDRFDGKAPSTGQNTHPTLKPLSLCKWLATLLLPPNIYAPRRILVPFSGTSSEMIGALQAGWDRVLGIEQEADYVEIARRRITYWIEEK